MTGLVPPAGTNTSATGGPLAPITGPATSTAEFENVVNTMIAGITGLPSDRVRPRWQPMAPVQPDINTDWCAFGIVERTPDANPVIRPIGPLEDGIVETQRHIFLETIATFYGPNATEYCAILRDGLNIPQNLEALFFVDAGLTDVGSTTRMPELINNQWVDRSDLRIRFIQREVRRYPIFGLSGATIQASAVLSAE